MSFLFQASEIKELAASYDALHDELVDLLKQLDNPDISISDRAVIRARMARVRAESSFVLARLKLKTMTDNPPGAKSLGRLYPTGPPKHTYTPNKGMGRMTSGTSQGF